jgi:hypothetical protein
MSEFLSEIEENGFIYREGVFSPETIDEVSAYCDTLRPERGHDKSKKWYGWKATHALDNPFEVDWAYYWSEQANHPAVTQIKDSLAYLPNDIFGEGNWSWHSQDFIVLYPGMDFVRPHIDTPYRFKEFKYEEKFLGLQFIVPLSDINETNGATGYVPGSHKYIIDPVQIQNNLSWEIFFLDNYKQHIAKKGSFVGWHPRLLHSTMPNKTNEKRKVLLLHISENTTERKLRTMDPSINPSLRTT